MAERQYDDSLLRTTEAMANVDWDAMETGGLISEGPHLMVVKKVRGYTHNFEKYTGPRAHVLLEVIQDGPDKGKLQYEDITLPAPGLESDGSRNRRLLIASRLGLVEKGCKETKDINWAVIQGQQVVITTIHKVSGGKTYSNVVFDGWDTPEGAAAKAAKEAIAAAPGQPAAAGAPGTDKYGDI